jgi:hypothetical protein
MVSTPCYQKTVDTSNEMCRMEGVDNTLIWYALRGLMCDHGETNGCQESNRRKASQ